MMLIEEITLHQFDADRWVVHTPQERNFLVNRATYQLILVLQNCGNAVEAVVAFNKQFQTSLNSQQFEQLIAEKLGGYHILKNDEEPEKPTLKNQYLKLKVELINARWAGWLSKPFQVFYSPKVFWWVLVAAVLIVANAYFMKNNALTLTGINYPLFFGLVYSAMLVHELGHIGACAKYGLKHGGIGFGFYFVLPVMYADITNIWLANKERRIITNMGGIFSELLYSTVLVLLFFLTQNLTFYAAGISIALFVVWEFNPFVRFDGYWILSDLTNTPNLIQKSKNVLGQTVSNISKGLLPKIERKNVWLLVYGFLNTLFFILFMGATVYSLHESIISFPVVLFNLLKKWFSGHFDLSPVSRSFLFIATFYLLVIRFLIQKTSLSWLKRVGQV